MKKSSLVATLNFKKQIKNIVLVEGRRRRGREGRKGLEEGKKCLVVVGR